MAGLVGRSTRTCAQWRSLRGRPVIVARGNEFNIDGTDAAVVARLVEELKLLLERGQVVDPSGGRTIDICVRRAALRDPDGRNLRPPEAAPCARSRAAKNGTWMQSAQHRDLRHRPRRHRQELSGCGLAVQALQTKSVDRIIMTARRRGRRTPGFLPGDLMAKIDPTYAPLRRPLRHAGTDGARRLLDNGTIEVAPLAYMRGRTLNGSFIILDEAQNATPSSSRCSSPDRLRLEGRCQRRHNPGGPAGRALRAGRTGPGPKRHRGIAFVRLGSRDVVRHRIVADIVSATTPTSRRPMPTPGRLVGVGARRSSPVTVEVFAADEQNDHPVDTLRWAACRGRPRTGGALGRRRTVRAFRGRDVHRRVEQQVPR